jgi:hypothetical protein
MRYGGARADHSPSSQETSVLKKLIFLIAIGALAYWLVKDRLGSEPDEFIFTEEPPPAPSDPEAPPSA